MKLEKNIKVVLDKTKRIDFGQYKPSKQLVVKNGKVKMVKNK